jgi:spore coat protein CotH
MPMAADMRRVRDQEYPRWVIRVIRRRWLGAWVGLVAFSACTAQIEGGLDATVLTHDAAQLDAGAVDAQTIDAADTGALSDSAIDAAAHIDSGPDASDAAAVMDAAIEPPPPPEFIALFDDAIFPTFEITLPPESLDALEAEPLVYTHGSFKYGDNVLADVGVRFKGRASLQGLDGKPSFKIKMNEYVSGTRFMGLKRMTLNNMVQDPSMLRECLAYKLFRALGLAAPMCNHARVYVNGTYYGLYSNVQSIDDVFVKWLYDPAPGNLYDQSNDDYFYDIERESSPPAQETHFILETNKPPDGMPITPELIADLTALIDAASTTTDQEFLAAIEEHMDLDQVLLVGATQAVLADWDGYFGATNNFMLYHELERDRFILLPWGLDQTMGMRRPDYQGPDYAIDHSGSERPNGLIHERCQANATCAARYVEKVEEAITAFDALALETDLDALYDKIEASALEDEKSGYSDQTFLDSVEELRDFIQKRSAEVRAQLP